MNADLRQLRYFIAVAEELNFTRAAARLHMTQQPLSAAIQRLESELGVDLFHRTTRRVELTDAGNALVEPARTALQAVDDALAAARAAGSGIAGELQFGLSTGARYGLEPLFAALDQRYPAVHLHTRHDSAVPLLAALQVGRLDVAVTFAAHIPADLEHLRLKNEPAVLAVAANHPVAGRHSVRLSELRDETFALDIPGDNPDYDKAVIESCRQNGFEPRTRVSSRFHDSWEGAVHSEGCVGLTVRTALHSTHRDLRLLTIEDAPTFPIELVWRNPTGTLRPAVTALVNTARHVCNEQSWT
ncbi:LysR family transcriptional regulator [Actinomadura rudentiformis]|uniref:LysR family transcriptional regulator n=1 Tax=Actinomadura rudentiformis TaxID=359158 RepID=A0A6H9Y6T4_9ACTN|nr:LysR substrate-binding domain-containing protein [Actinomadura rudentiformis]KAB2340144.1 LysR family transcriptional regulator [Actinomadura rudentiformis]